MKKLRTWLLAGATVGVLALMSFTVSIEHNDEPTSDVKGKWVLIKREVLDNGQIKRTYECRKSGNECVVGTISITISSL